MSWHVETELLERYAAGTLPDAAAWSVEAHVVDCETCRSALVEVPGDLGGVTDARLDAAWSVVASGTRQLQRGRFERGLVRLGVAEHTARLLLATPAFVRSWLLGVVAALAVTLSLAWAAPGRPLLPFLLVAPLLPVAGIAGAFGPRVDPAYEVAVVAPMSSFRLLLLRTMTVLAVTLGLAGLAAAALPVAGWTLAVWLLPSLAMTATVLAASTRWQPIRAAVVVASVWGAAVIGPALVGAGVPLVYGAGGQLAAAVLLAGAAAVLIRRRDRFEGTVMA